MRNWTPEQEAAITARGASVVISAAAGSGKTSVLVERLTQLLTDPAYPAEKMVVVTFTNDAAGEVRARLSRALTAKVLDEPENEWLRRQQTMLQSASISTIHSYCLRLLREQFAQLDISANFRVMDETEAEELRRSCIAELLEDFSASAEKDDAAKQKQALLFEAFCTQDDTPLEQLLLSLHALTEDFPFGETLLPEAAKACESGSILQTAREMIASALHEILGLYPPAIGLAAQMQSEKTELALKAEYQQLQEIARTAAQADAGTLCAALRDMQFAALRSLPRKGFEEEKSALKSLRSFAKERCEQLKSTWILPLQYADKDIPRHAALLKVLAELVQDFDARYALRKRERNAVTFNDAMTMALSLLAIRHADGTIEKTPLAEQLSQQYVCIMIDEFQDANNQQDMIFRMLSRGGSAAQYGDNLFVVGDSKQCIYRFRNANPENFSRAMREGAPYRQPQLTENTCIHLNRNFRSAEEVVTVINHIFGMLMTERVGEIGYDDTQKLVQGAVYPPARRPAEVILIPQSKDAPNPECAVIAKRIAWHLSHGTPVKGADDALRPCEPRDFLILLRTKTHMEEYAAALAAAGVPVCSTEHSDYLKSPEILLLLDILRAIDNPLPEIPVASAMLSPLFGFTVDELLQVRLYNRNKRLFQTMLQIRRDAEEGKSTADEVLLKKCCTLLDFLDNMRLCAAMDTPEQLIRRIFRQTDFLGLMQMTAGGAQKKANLRALTAYAHNFEENRGGGLSAFLRYLDAVLARKSDLEAGSVPAGTENVVQIKTIHASKGLEAPFVILANAERAFSHQDAASVFQYHPETGIGFQLHDPETMSKGRSLPWTVVLQRSDCEMRSEELRLLYVALTRAREYLILPLAYTESRAAKVFSVYADVQRAMGGQTDMLTAAAGNMADWLIMALARNPACELLRRETALTCGSDPQQPFLPVAVWAEQPADSAGSEQEADTADAAAEPDPALTAQLAAQCAWHYESRLADLTAKYGVSELAKQEDFSAPLQRPQFITERRGLTGTERGTAVHTFMQYVDFAAAAADPEAEIRRCRDAGRLTQRQADAVRQSKIAAFFRSELYEKITKAVRVMREQKFMVRLSDLTLSGPLAQLGRDYAGTDGMLTGIMDLVLEEPEGIVLVDYKTDTGLDADGLLAEYTEQIRLYAEALSLLTEKPVCGCYLYSVPLCRTIPVRFAETEK